MRLSRSFFCAIFLFSCLTLTWGQQECLPDDERVDCHPDVNATEEACLSRGCLWCPPSTDPPRNTPVCHFKRQHGYKMVSPPEETERGVVVQLHRLPTPPLFGNEWENLTLFIDFQSDSQLHILITDEGPRWLVPIELDSPSNPNVTENRLYQVYFTDEPSFSFRIVRRATGAILFDSSLGGLSFSDQFIQVGWKLPSRNVYGLGENEQHSLRHSFDNRPVFPLWTIGSFPDHEKNLYGAHPHLTVLEDDGNAHSLLILNSNAQEWEMHPSPGIVYRTTGGVLDMFMFLGPTPEETAKQYTGLVGRHPLPPYWALGFHLSRYGYGDIETMKATVNRTIEAGIPYDVQYGDIDIMDRNLDFTVSAERFPGLNEYVLELKSQGIRFVTILDPCISAVEERGQYKPYDLGEELDVWVKRSDGVTPARAQVWPGVCHFPDFSKNSTKQWWSDLIMEFKNSTLDFDALWIDMNEPSNFVSGELDEGCEVDGLNNPPFYPKSLRDENLFTATLCPNNVDSLSSHYNTHSLYGHLMSRATASAAQATLGKRTFTLTRSSFTGTGRTTTHWLGDNYSSWDSLRVSIIGMLQFNLFGIPFVGADICGHLGNTTDELCRRWHQLGAFYPFSRNHNANDALEQDPASFPGGFADSVRFALQIRYTLLPYLYTLLAEHEVSGGTVARAMWSVFPKDVTARGIDRQFLWGEGLLITPVLDEGDTTVQAYFPDSRFYDYHTGAEVEARAEWVELRAPLNHINLHVHGGHIIPTQEPDVNTELAREKPFGLVVALDDEWKAEGKLFYDDGESLDPMQTGNYFEAHITAGVTSVRYTVVVNEYEGMANKRLDTVRLLGVRRVPTRVLINGRDHKQFSVLPSGEVYIENLRLFAAFDFTLHYE